MYSMSISMSYLYHILYNTLIFNMVYFRGGEVISSQRKAREMIAGYSLCVI